MSHTSTAMILKGRCFSSVSGSEGQATSEPQVSELTLFRVFGFCSAGMVPSLSVVHQLAVSSAVSESSQSWKCVGGSSARAKLMNLGNAGGDERSLEGGAAAVGGKF